MKKVLGLIVLLVLSSSAWAFQPSIIGGIRDGAALGFLGDFNVARNVDFRVGLELDTAKDTPIVGLFGGKIYLTPLGGDASLSLGLGLVGYFGTRTEAGLALSCIFDRVFTAVRPLYIEAGIDFVNSARLQLQLGYRY